MSLDKIPEIDKTAKEALGDEFFTHIQGWSKDMLRQQFINLSLEYVKLRAELEGFKKPNILLPN